MSSHPCKAVLLAVAMVCMALAGATGGMGRAYQASVENGSVANELLPRDRALLGLPDAVLRLPDTRPSGHWIDTRQGERRAPSDGLTSAAAVVAALLTAVALALFADNRFGLAVRGNPRQGRAPPLSQLV